MSSFTTKIHATPQKVRNALVATMRDLNDVFGDQTSGWGILLLRDYEENGLSEYQEESITRIAVSRLIGEMEVSR